ncbi:sphingomyelin phosphodiesterase 5-like [Columba livia]|uniref:sphingomyelin phosphodiesterase 5-like n=1 Tax=Columba livia TaxID=8932 RepID=UPI0031BAD5EC
MLPHDSPFPNRALAALDRLAEGLLAPGFWAANGLLDLRPTTAERRRRRRRRCGRCRGCTGALLAGGALVAVLLLSLPVTALGLLLWLPLQAARRPFRYRYTAGTAAAEPWDLRQPRTFTFLSANVCLLPSGLAKFSNLGDTARRASAIARQLAPRPPPAPGARAGLLEPRRDSTGYGGTLRTPALARAGAVQEATPAGTPTATPAGTSTVTLAGTPAATPAGTSTVTPAGTPTATPAGTPTVTPVGTPTVTPAGTSTVTLVGTPTVTPAGTPAGTSTVTPAGPEAAEPVLSERFPADTDFVCLQEVFDGAAASRVCGQLAGAFPHVLWDVGERGLRGGRPVLLGSGLLLASRFPPLAARYRPFPNGRGEDALAAKGLLVAQVLLGSARGRRVVGYIGCTHLQAPAADAATREEQLSLSLRWLQLFREEQEQRGDLVAFDVLCGDLNFDNCSRGDELNQRHQLFQLYQDPCRRGAGLDAPWAIGTLLNYLRIYEEPVSTPEKMRRTLSQPGGRQRYLAGPILASGEPDPLAPGPWRGRRVDYIVYRQHRGARTEVAGVSVITQLATRSDHLPVALRLRVAPDQP